MLICKPLFSRIVVTVLRLMVNYYIMARTTRTGRVLYVEAKQQLQRQAVS